MPITRLDSEWATMIDIVILLFSIVINTRKESKTMDNNKTEEQSEKKSTLEKIVLTGEAKIIIPERKEDDESED